MLALQNVCHWTSRWNNVENRSAFGEYASKNIVALFDSQRFFHIMKQENQLLHSNINYVRWVKLILSHVPFILKSNSENALKNLLIFDEVTDKTKLAPFYSPQCIRWCAHWRIPLNWTIHVRRRCSLFVIFQMDKMELPAGAVKATEVFKL